MERMENKLKCREENQELGHIKVLFRRIFFPLLSALSLLLCCICLYLCKSFITVHFKIWYLTGRACAHLIWCYNIAVVWGFISCQMVSAVSLLPFEHYLPTHVTDWTSPFLCDRPHFLFLILQLHLATLQDVAPASNTVFKQLRLVVNLVVHFLKNVMIWTCEGPYECM